MDITFCVLGSGRERQKDCNTNQISHFFRCRTAQDIAVLVLKKSESNTFIWVIFNPTLNKSLDPLFQGGGFIWCLSDFLS